MKKIIIALFLIGFFTNISIAEGYYQFTPVIGYHFSKNIYDFSNIIKNDSESYSFFSLRLWWNTSSGNSFLRGDMNIKLWLNPSGKLFYSGYLFNRNWQYTTPSLSRGKGGDIRILIRKLYMGFEKKNSIFAGVGVIPLDISDLCFSDAMAGARGEIFLSQALSLGVWGGFYHDNPADGNYFIIDNCVERGCYGSGGPSHLFYGADGTIHRNHFNVKFFTIHTDQISNMGFRGNFKGKAGEIHVEYAIGKNTQSRGDAFLISFLLGNARRSISLGYMEISGFDYTLPQNMEQTAYIPVRSGLMGGIIWNHSLRNLPPSSIISMRGKITPGKFEIDGNYFYYQAIGYKFPFAENLGSEVNLITKWDNGPIFVEIKGAFFHPGSGLEDLINSALKNSNFLPSAQLEDAQEAEVLGGIRF